MSELVGPRTEIRWAKLVPEPKTGDPMSTEMGITRIGVGNIFYQARFHGLQREIDQRSIPSGDKVSTRLYVGRADTQNTFLKVVFNPASPITLDDAERINASLDLALNVYQTETAWRAGRTIQEIVDRFEQSIKQAIPDTDVDTFSAIAVAVDRLKQYARRDYPEEFLKLAERMDALGIKSIEPSAYGKHLDFWSADYIRKVFGKKREDDGIAS